MKRFLITLIIALTTSTQVLADDSTNFDVIEFQRDEEKTSLINPTGEIFQIRVEKNAPSYSKEAIRGLDDLGRINIYDQKSYRKYDRGVTDKTIALDENTNVILGSHNLYSAIGPSINFIRRESSYGDYGYTFITKSKYVNLAAAAYNSSIAVGNSGGVVVSSAPVKLPVGELIVGSAVYSTNLGVKETAHYGFFNQFRYKKFKFNTQLSKYKPNSSLDLEANTVFLQPEIDLTDSLSVSTGIQNDVTNKNSRSDLTLKYHPVKSDRNLELEVTLTNFAKPGNSTTQQRMYLGTKFKI
ncbi:hypothetical protein IJE86_00520 [bacterium]|nr:hypothetical protein [bacterium]